MTPEGVFKNFRFHVNSEGIGLDNASVADSPDRDFYDWVGRTFGQASEGHDGPYTRDLIMRPTDEPAGVYEAGDGSSRVVGEHDGQNYLLIWCGAGELQERARKGDVLVTGAYPIPVEKR